MKENNKLSRLKKDILEQVHQDLLEGKKTLKQIADYIQDESGLQISNAALCRYRQKVSKNFKALIHLQEEVAKYSEKDRKALVQSPLLLANIIQGELLRLLSESSEALTMEHVERASKTLLNLSKSTLTFFEIQRLTQAQTQVKLVKKAKEVGGTPSQIQWLRQEILGLNEGG